MGKRDIINKYYKHIALYTIVDKGAGISIIAVADIHKFVFTDCKNNRFQKKLLTQNTNIMNICLAPIIDFPAPLIVEQS